MTETFGQVSRLATATANVALATNNDVQTGRSLRKYFEPTELSPKFVEFKRRFCCGDALEGPTAYVPQRLNN
jgi:hypothetical protein